MLKPEYIAKATFNAFQELKDPQKTTEGLLRFLKQKGALKLLPKIVHEMEKLISAQRKSEGVLVVARAQDEPKALKQLGIKHAPQVQIDPTLIGGYMYKDKSKLVINDYKHHLINLYNQIISKI